MDWEHLVHSLDGNRYLPNGTAETRDGRHATFIREFASAVSLLHVSSRILVLFHG